MSDIRVRIAPSPTGFAHVGTAYTALFNWAFAKSNNGAFIIRIEDSDVKRNVKGAEEAIFKGLSWLGIDWDESVDVGGKYEPYRLSDRLDIYRKQIDELVSKKLAFIDDGAVRFRNPNKEVGWDDLIRGEINFSGDQITDFVIQKSDGYPTYNFAVVVDDIAMKISHVIRGEEHISNTPRQLVLYDAFGVKPPKFAHHPTLRNKERKKLSKRRDPVDLMMFKEQGYLPEALINFLGLLGWSHPQGKEIFSLEEFAKLFDLKRVRKAGPIFNTDKLDWLNGEYLRRLDIAEFKKRLHMSSKKWKKVESSKLDLIIPLVQTRIKKMSEFDSIAGFFLERPKVDKKSLGKNYKKHLELAIETLNNDRPLEEAPKKNDFKVGEFFMDLRVAITGNKVSPPINESIEILGKNETLDRLRLIV